MNALAKLLVSALVGTIVPSLPLMVLALFTFGNGFFAGLMSVALMVVAIHIIFLGIPVFLLLKYINLLNGYSLTLAWFVAGLIPIAVVNLFNPLTSNFLTFMFLGTMGAVSGLAFWLTWCKLGRDASSKSTELDSSLRRHK